MQKPLYSIFSALAKYQLRHVFGGGGHRILQPKLQWSRASFYMQYSTSNEDLKALHLKDRTLLRITGTDTSQFLQGLITNDMECLNFEKDQCSGSLYTFFLNIQGRILYDMILYNLAKRKKEKDQEPSLLIECSSDVSTDIAKLIQRYKIRKKVKISAVGEEYNVWAIMPSSPTSSDPPVPVLQDPPQAVMCEPDPRLKLLGHRLILPSDLPVASVIPGVGEATEATYRELRYRLGVAEGPKELPTGNCLPLESNAVFLKGVSFNKGCYIGQELTARSYHTGLTRKRIMPLLLHKSIPLDSEGDMSVFNVSNKKCGVIRGSLNRYAIGLMRIPDTVGKGPLVVKNNDGETLGTATAVIPHWWQTDTDQILKQVLTDFPEAINSDN